MTSIRLEVIPKSIIVRRRSRTKPRGTRNEGTWVTMMISNRRKWLRRGLGIGLGGFALEQTWRHGHDYVLTREFREIEPGKVYRGGWQKNIPLRRVIRERQIRTIVALAHPPDSPLVESEKRIAEEMGVRFVHLPIHDVRGDHNRTFVSDQLEKAAQIIGDPANQPVFFHCHHGLNRASMAHIAYRTMMCGWSLGDAQKEVADQFGLIQVSKGPDYRHMERFYEDRVQPYRLAKQARDTAEPAVAKSKEGPAPR